MKLQIFDRRTGVGLFMKGYEIFSGSGRLIGHIAKFYHPPDDSIGRVSLHLKRKAFYELTPEQLKYLQKVAKSITKNTGN